MSIILKKATNGLSLNGLGSGIVKSTSGVLGAVNSIEISDVNNLQSSLNNINSDITNIQDSIDNLGGSSGLSEIDVVKILNHDSGDNIDNFGKNWNQLTNSPTNNGVGNACSGDGKIVLKLGWSASCYISRDFGNTWEVASSLGSYQWSAALSHDGKYILCISILGQKQLSTDYGVNWSYVNTIGGTPNDVAVSHSGKYMVCATDNGIYYSSDSGATFSSIATSSWKSVCITDDGSSIVAIKGTSPVTIWKTSNAGTNWTEIYSNSSSVDFGKCICSSDGKFILLALSQGTINYMHLSSNYGSTFSEVGASAGLSSANYFRIAMSSSGIYMVAGCNSGNVFISKDYGSSWSASPLPSNSYYGISMSKNAHNIYAYAPNTKMFNYNSNITSIRTAEVQYPSKGGMYFDEATNKLYVYNSSSGAWKSVTLA